MMEQLIITWYRYNSICCPLANIQMDSIFGLSKDETNQYEKAVFDYPSQSPKQNHFFVVVSTRRSCQETHGFIFNHEICFWIYEQ